MALVAAAPAAAAQAHRWRAAWGWGPDPLAEKHEELFDAPWPSRRPDPFLRLRPFDDVRAFNRAFDRRVAGATTRLSERDGAAVLEIEWPGSAARGMDVRVTRRAVLARAAAAPRASPYRFERASAELEVPLPFDAEPGAARVERSGDVLRVTFARRK